jgi:hypothetical protein
MLMTMRPQRPHARWVVCLTLLALMTATVRSAEEELDTDLMQTIEDTNKSMASHIALMDPSGSLSDAAELHAMFEKVDAFYTHKGDAADAVELARKTLNLTVRIQELVKAKDFRSATDAATELSRTCKTCHNFYKKT